MRALLFFILTRTSVARLIRIVDDSLLSFSPFLFLLNRRFVNRIKAILYYFLTGLVISSVVSLITASLSERLVSHIKRFAVMDILILKLDC